MVVDKNHDKTLRHKEHEVLVVNQVNFLVYFYEQDFKSPLPPFFKGGIILHFS